MGGNTSCVRDEKYISKEYLLIKRKKARVTKKAVCRKVVKRKVSIKRKRRRSSESGSGVGLSNGVVLDKVYTPID